MITCRELIDFLDRYVAGELSPTQRQVVDRHLAVCRSCRSYLESYRRTMQLTRLTLHDGDAPATDVPEALVWTIERLRASA